MFKTAKMDIICIVFYSLSSVFFFFYINALLLLFKCMLPVKMIITLDFYELFKGLYG